jgi:hypothetical protein
MSPDMLSTFMQKPEVQVGRPEPAKFVNATNTVGVEITPTYRCWARHPYPGHPLDHVPLNWTNMIPTRKARRLIHVPSIFYHEELAR